ncbi:hypothetical protein [Aeromonas allosaccharophila]|uniref:hypothetical protein n=2 Tax=Aeromonas allosaccharophila TaxID=656 RepID=UPI0035B8B5D4
METKIALQSQGISFAVSVHYICFHVNYFTSTDGDIPNLPAAWRTPLEYFSQRYQQGCLEAEIEAYRQPSRERASYHRVVGQGDIMSKPKQSSLLN